MTYEEFGATGDGVTDDLDAICAAHEHANARGLRVRSHPQATYHLGRRALTVKIATDTDWNTSRFTIDDTDVEDHKASIFEVCSLLDAESVPIDRLRRDQAQVPVRPRRDCYVAVRNDRVRRYIRRGLNQNRGVPQRDCFVLRQNGSVEGAIDWNYETITEIIVRPVDATTLFLRGGVFTTVANSMKQETGYNYWARNIRITRSNTEVAGLTHYVVGETAVGHPYRGFLDIAQCADITLRDCFVSGHKTYMTIGSAGKPVSMGTYDLHANEVVNLRLVGCRMNHILDRTRWGVMATNFCKNILLEECVLSRMDSHMGVSGSYIIRRSTLGHAGLNAIGRGTLLVENSTLYGRALVSLRGDYGSTWEGEVAIRNSRWIPACGEPCQPYLIAAVNDGMHDFGYPCYLPSSVSIDRLFVDDRNHIDGYEGMYLFSDPDGDPARDTELPPPPERPHALAPCRVVTLGRLTTASGKRARLSPNEQMRKHTRIIEEGNAKSSDC